MKKIKSYFLILTVSILTLLVLAACGQSSDESSGEKLTGAFSTGSSGGLYDLLGGGMANIINQKSENIKLNSTVPPSISEVPRMLDTKQAIVGIGMADMMQRAKEGVGEFDQPYESIKPAFAMYDNVMAIVTTADSPIKNIKDLKGKKVGVSSKSTQDVVSPYLELAGVPHDEVEWVFLSYSEQAEALKEGSIDVGNFTSYPKAGLLEDLSTSRKGLKFLEIDEDIREEWDKEYPLWANGITPKETYKGMDKDSNYYTMFTVLYVNSGLSEDNVYEITKAVFDNYEDISVLHPAAKDIKPEKTKEYIEKNIIDQKDLHPGALKYFKEKGILE